MSACICASVWAVAVRPTGPAATEPSAPSVNLLESSLSAPRALITNMIKSVEEPPIWKPTLPPSMRTVPGADQPVAFLFRQDKYPFPYLPPNTKAAVFRFGTITMQWACSSSSCGMPLSGVAMTSENTAAASFRRFAGSLSLASNGVRANAAMIISLIFHLFQSTRFPRFRPVPVQGRWLTMFLQARAMPISSRTRWDKKDGDFSDAVEGEVGEG